MPTGSAPRSKTATTQRLLEKRHGEPYLRETTSTITEEGQVTIPKRVREDIRLHAGDEVSFEKVNEGYALRKTVEDDRFEWWRGAVETNATIETRIEALRGR